MATDNTNRDRIAICIASGSNVGNVINASAGSPAATTAGSATSVLVDRENVSFGFSRVATDPENYGDTYYQKPGSFISLTPSLSFSVPLRGGLFTDTADLDVSRALLFSGCGIGATAGDVVPDVSDPSLFTSYNLSQTAVDYQTIKLWRGDEAWAFTNCFSNVTMSFEANQPGILSVEVFASSVQYIGPNSGSAIPYIFPSSMGYQEYSNADYGDDIWPILEKAAMSIGVDDRPLLTGSISVQNTTLTIPDSNAPDGFWVEPDGRTVEFSGTFLEESTQTASEFDYLSTTGVTSSDVPSVSFVLGNAWDQENSGIANSLGFGINALRITDVQKSEFSGGRIANTISGYAATTGSGTDIPFYVRSR